MALSVRERGDAVATFRFVAVHLMETLAGWVPTTPEMEVKILFGRHLWDMAQHADAFGKRTAELRLSLHASRPPRPALRAALDQLRATLPTGRRLDDFYLGVLPFLERLYGSFLGRTDHLMDEPTVRILEHALLDLSRMRREAEAPLAEEIVPAAGAGEVADLVARLTTLEQAVDFRPATPAEVEV